MSRLRAATLAAICMLAIGSPASAAQRNLAGSYSILNKPLGCAIEQYKVLVITNTSGGTIPSGTTISYSYERMPDHSQISATVKTGGLGPGALLKRGITPAYSCKASYRRQLVNAPATQ